MLINLLCYLYLFGIISCSIATFSLRFRFVSFDDSDELLLGLFYVFIPVLNYKVMWDDFYTHYDWVKNYENKTYNREIYNREIYNRESLQRIKDEI